ncbi:MAG: InlB B-repeat-containing protein [Thermomicrobiales bacterium]
MGKRLAVVGALLVNLVATALLVAAPASAATTTTIVSQSNLQGWGFYNDTDNTSRPPDFVGGPGTPPLGTGSAHLAVDSTGREILATGAYASTRLADITDLSYSAYRHLPADTSLPQTISFQFDVDYDLTAPSGAYHGRLVYEPYQAGIQPAIDTWQTFNPLAGKWWQSKNDNGGQMPCPQSAPCTTAQVLQNWPNIGVWQFGAVLLRAGGPWPGGFDGNVDSFTIGVNSNVTTYNFETDVDLNIAMQAQPTSVNAGQNVTYTITAGNSGASAAADVKVVDALPAATTFVSCQATNNGVCDGTDNDRVISFSTLAPNASATITLVAQVKNTTADGATVTNSATINGSSLDANAYNNSATASVQVSNPPPAPQSTVTLTVGNGGTVTPGAGSYTYDTGSVATFTAQASQGNVFLGWTVDGTFVGFNTTLNLPVTNDRTVSAAFAAPTTFCDVTATTPYADAIWQLSARGVARGFANPHGSGNCFGPSDPVIRAQTSGFLARMAGWDKNQQTNTFPDRCDANGQNCIDAELWNDVSVLAFHDVARGFADHTFRPRANVVPGQVISFVARTFVAKGWWVPAQQDDPNVYPGVPADSGHRLDVLTYAQYAGVIPGTTGKSDPWNDPNTGWSAQASRSWVAGVIWQAYNAYWSTNHIP